MHRYVWSSIIYNNRQVSNLNVYQEMNGKEDVCVCVCVCVCIIVVLYLLSCVWFFSNPMDYSPPDSPVLGIPQASMGCHFLLQELFLTEGWNLHLLHWQVDSLLLSYQESPPPKEETNDLIYKRVIDLQTITLWLTKEKGEQGIN